jgi:hypothetical protein
VLRIPTENGASAHRISSSMRLQSRLLCPWTCQVTASFQPNTLLLSHQTTQYSWERDDGKVQDGDLIKLFEKPPRDQVLLRFLRFECDGVCNFKQFAIFESRFSEVLCLTRFPFAVANTLKIMLFSLNMPICDTQMAESFYPEHCMAPYLNAKHPLFNPYGEKQSAYGAACDS